MVLSPAAHQGEETELDAQDETEQEANADKEKRLTAQRTWALDQLLHVGKNGGVQKDEEAMKGMLEFLAVVGWFEVTKEASKGAVRLLPPSSPLSPSH
jgi:DNA polymerase phi